MSDLFDILPAELFVQVIFSRLSLCNVMLIRVINKKSKELVTDYQKVYNKTIHTSYDCLQWFEDNMPKSACSVDIFVTNKVISIKSYRVMRYLTISFVDENSMGYGYKYDPDLYNLSESIIDYFDVSNLQDLKRLSLYYIPNNHKIPTLLSLNNLIKLEICETNISLDISCMTNLTLLNIVCSNDIKFHIKNVNIFTETSNRYDPDFINPYQFLSWINNDFDE